MTTNEEQLAYLRKRMIVLELLERLSSCGLVWDKISPTQYHTSQDQDGFTWDVNLTKLATGTIYMDFQKNKVFFYGLDSTAEDSLVELFDEVDGDVDYRKDMEIMQAVGQVQGCGD